LIASTGFIIHFYQQILDGIQPTMISDRSTTIALRATQTWMQKLTWQKLADWLTELRQFPTIPSDPYDRLTARIANILKKHDTINELTDYHHPYYWSAFVLTGEG
jgi:CHAT domain-containing protein